jgi:hypothetical protein
MLYREIITLCSQIHKEHINTPNGQKVELVNVKPGGTYSKHCTLEGSISLIKTSQVMLYTEIIAVCFKIHKKHINTLCG